MKFMLLLGALTFESHTDIILAAVFFLFQEVFHKEKKIMICKALKEWKIFFRLMKKIVDTYCQVGHTINWIGNYLIDDLLFVKILW